MKGTHLIAFAAAFALGITGAAPISLLTGEAQASGRKAPAKSQNSRKTREPRAKSKKASSSKVSSAKKRGNSAKKQARKATGKSAKQNVPATASAPVAGPAPLKGILKNGTVSRASITAVNGVPLATPPSSAARGPERRASLDVNTSPRSPRSKTVKNRSAGKAAENGRKKSSRAGGGRNAKSALAPAGTPSGSKVTFNGYTQVVTFDGSKAANRVESPPRLEPLNDTRPRPSTVSEVLPRLPLGTRSQGRLRGFVGKVVNAVRYGVLI